MAKVIKKNHNNESDGRKPSILVEDETGRTKLNLDEDQACRVQVGDKIMIRGVFTEVNGRFLEISSWKDIEVLQSL